jgi:dimethylamine monooxygenase subunit A
MGLRPADAPGFFAREPGADVILAERAHWLDTAPAEYAALLDEGIPALEEYARISAGWGVLINEDQSLQTLARACEPDFALLPRGEDGVFRLAGGAVCFPSSWALREKLGKPLEEIHAPVPNLNPSLARQIHTFLDRIIPGAAWARENWGLSRDCELNHHPSLPHRQLDAGISITDVWLRLERQLLFKLPATGAILFGIRVDVHPLQGMPASARNGLARTIGTMPPSILAYKGLSTAREALLEMCGDHSPGGSETAPAAQCDSP